MVRASEPLILEALKERPMMFRELVDFTGDSYRSLSYTLRSMVRYGLVDYCLERRKLNNGLCRRVRVYFLIEEKGEGE